MVKTHKQSGWQREPIGFVQHRITPTDNSGVRIVAFYGAGDWHNDPFDDRARQDEDRVILQSGNPLPDWAMDWLETVNHRQREAARERFRAALDDADNHLWNDY